MRIRRFLSRLVVVELLAWSAFAAFMIFGPVMAQVPVQSATQPGGRLDAFQFKSVCELQKRMPNPTAVNCHCAGTVYERYVHKEIARFDDMIKYYEEKMRTEAEKIGTWARAADRQRDQRKQFLQDSLRNDTQVFKDIMLLAARECPPR